MRLWTEGFEDHLDERRSVVEAEVGDEGRRAVADLAETAQLDVDVWQLGDFEGLAEFFVRLFHVGSCPGEVLDDDGYGFRQSIDDLGELPRGKRPHVLTTAYGEADFGGGFPQGLRRARRQAYARDTALGPAGQIIRRGGGCLVDHADDREPSIVARGAVQQVGVVVHAAVLNEDGLLNAVRVHLVDESLDRLEPTRSRVSMRVNDHVQSPPKACGFHDTRARRGLTTRGTIP